MQINFFFFFSATLSPLLLLLNFLELGYLELAIITFGALIELKFMAAAIRQDLLEEIIFKVTAPRENVWC